MTWRQLLSEGEHYLKKAGVEEAKLDAWYLFSKAFSMDRVHFLMNQNETTAGSEFCILSAGYRRMLEERASRIPLQYVLGTQEFMGLEFIVDGHVLIPRQDTETLVERVLADYPRRDLTILDMCTGSGCIAISLKKMGGYRLVVGADISSEALAVARENGKRICGEEMDGIAFTQSDLFERIEGRYHVIVSNPPYIPSKVVDGLEPEVRDHEPRMALDGGKDGLSFYRRLADEGKNFLLPGGAVYFEIGYDQAEAVTKLLKDCGYRGIEIMKDGPGLDRVVKAVLSDEEVA